MIVFINQSNQKTIWLIGLFVVIIMTSFFMDSLHKGPKMYKGTWIWEAPTIINHTEDIISFAKQNDVTHIYLYVDRYNVAPQDYAFFIKKAAENDMKVEALQGDPTWGRKENQPYIGQFIEWVHSYNNNVNEDERFAGIHLDIEPYLLSEWNTNQNEVIAEWLSNMEFAAKKVSLYGSLKVTVDIPFWLHKIELPGYEHHNVSTWMLKRFDTVVLMDYRDTAEGDDGIVSNAIDIVNEASAMGKSVIIGVEMGQSDEGDKATFYEEGYHAMKQESAVARHQLKKRASFRGVAIHGFPEWMASYQQAYPETNIPFDYWKGESP